MLEVPASRIASASYPKPDIFYALFTRNVRTPASLRVGAAVRLFLTRNMRRRSPSAAFCAKENSSAMDRQEAKDILLLYRAGKDPDSVHPRMREALAEAEHDPELGQWFKAHRTLDDTVRSGFLQIAVPESLRERILTCPKITGLVAWWQQRPDDDVAAPGQEKSKPA